MEIQPVTRSGHRAARFRQTVVGAAIIAVAATMWVGHAGQGAGGADVMLLYVGAEDCAPCRTWQRGEGAAFFASPLFARITYREVKSAHLHDVLKDENWPNEMRPYRDGLRPSDGVPLWLIVTDHKVVQRSFGAAEWRASVRPAIESLLR